MIPAAFEYERADSVDRAIELLGSDEDAKLLAGGHSLIPLLRLRFARPSLLVDIGRLGDLRYVREDGDRIAIGALTRHAEVVRDPLLAKKCKIVADAAHLVGDPQVRHRGTIGGSIAHGDPASDLATVLLTLDADLVARGPAGSARSRRRTSSAARSRRRSSARRCSSRSGSRPPTGTYLKHQRRAHDWATVGVAAARVDGDVNVGLASMGPTPLRAKGVEEAFAGGLSATEAAERAAEGADPPSDINGSSEYRAHLAQVLVRPRARAALSALPRRMAA